MQAKLVGTRKFADFVGATTNRPVLSYHTSSIPATLISTSIDMCCSSESPCSLPSLV